MAFRRRSTQRRARRETQLQALARTDPLNNIIPAGTNDIVLYFQAGRSNDPHGVGIAETFEQRVLFQPPNTKTPPGTIGVTPEDFVVGR